MTKCQTHWKIWHLELFWWDLQCNLTLSHFLGRTVKKTTLYEYLSKKVRNFALVSSLEALVRTPEICFGPSANGIKIKCSNCPESFGDYNSYVNHRKKCTKYACHTKSDHRGDRERLGTQHPVYKSQVSSLSGSSKCLKCSKIVLTKNMSRHMREKHPLDIFGDEYKCDLCDKTFKSVRSISSHVKRFHP